MPRPSFGGRGCVHVRAPAPYRRPRPYDRMNGPALAPPPARPPRRRPRGRLGRHRGGGEAEALLGPLLRRPLDCHRRPPRDRLRNEARASRPGGPGHVRGRPGDGGLHDRGRAGRETPGRGGGQRRGLDDMDAGGRRRLRGLHPVRPSGFLLRFVFGCAISIAAALVGMRFGQRLGGLFLAFPAILPASLTLIEEEEGDDPASINATGAVIGGAALVAFAATAAWLLPRRPPLLALAAAAAVWLR